MSLLCVIVASLCRRSTPFEKKHYVLRIQGPWGFLFLQRIDYNEGIHPATTQTTMYAYLPQTELEKLLIKYPDKPWDWEQISANPNLTLDLIDAHPDKPWYWYWISLNPNCTMDFIDAHPDKPWSWESISQNPNLTLDFIDAHPDKPWDWRWISENPNFTLDFIDAHPDKPWDWEWISGNPNLTMDFIDAHPDKPWDWEKISQNKFGWKEDNTIRYYKKRQTKTIRQTLKLKEELIATAWHPRRYETWCLDEQTKKEFEESY